MRKNNEFKFGIQEKEAFLTLNENLCDETILKIYDQNTETELHMLYRCL